MATFLPQTPVLPPSNSGTSSLKLRYFLPHTPVLSSLNLRYFLPQTPVLPPSNSGTLFLASTCLKEPGHDFARQPGCGIEAGCGAERGQPVGAADPLRRGQAAAEPVADHGAQGAGFGGGI